MVDNQVVENRAPSTLSESIRYAADHIPLRPIVLGVAQMWADEVAALEGQLVMWEGSYRTLSSLLDGKEPAPITPVDKLNQGYERAGLSSALVVNNKYGKHSAFGYMGRE